VLYCTKVGRILALNLAACLYKNWPILKVAMRLLLYNQNGHVLYTNTAVFVRSCVGAQSMAAFVPNAAVFCRSQIQVVGFQASIIC